MRTFSTWILQLKEHIHNGKTTEVQQLLGPFTNKKDIRWIEDKVLYYFLIGQCIK